MKNYRFLGKEAEILGQRLDAARDTCARAKRDSWAKNYWQQVIDSLLFQWRQLPVLHDGDAQMQLIPRWTVSYDFYELAQPHEEYGITDKFYDRIFKHDAELDASWHSHREQRLAKAQY
jgi:hypothetical protein